MVGLMSALLLLGVSGLVAAPALDILFLGANDTGDAGADAEVLAFLEQAFSDGTVSYMNSGATDGSEVADVIVMSSTFGSGSVRGKFHNSPVGILNWEEALMDSGDGEFGQSLESMTKSTDVVTMSLIDHPAAGDLAGLTIEFFTGAGPETLGSAELSLGTEAVGTAVDGSISGLPMLFVTETGEAVGEGAGIVGNISPARRVAFPMTDNSFNELTDDGKQLLANAIIWAASADTQESSIQQGLVAHWPLNEGSGDVFSEVVEGFDGFLPLAENGEQTTVSWSDGPPTQQNSVEFSGANSFIATDFPGIGGGNPRTVAFWVRTLDENAYFMAWGSNAAARKWHIRANGASGVMRTEYAGGQNFATTSLIDGEWHHVASVFPNGATEGEEILHYLDGVLDPRAGGGNQTIDTATVTGENFNWTDANSTEPYPVHIGAVLAHGFGRMLIGSIADVGIWNRGLTEDEINQLVNNSVELLIDPLPIPRYGRIKVRVNGVSSSLTDVPEFIVDPNSIKLLIDGEEAAAGSVTIGAKVDGRIDIDYSIVPDFFVSDFEHTIAVLCADTAGDAFDSGPRDFTTPAYSTVDSANRVEGVDTSKGGFRVFAYQTAASAPNRVFWSEEALRGEHGANLADMNVGPDLDRDGFGDIGGPSGVNGFIDPTVINYDATGGAGTGKFQDPDFIHPVLSDAAVAGILSDLAGGDQNNSHHEITTYIEFPTRDIYTMGVTSDDGFKVSIAGSNRDVLGQVLGFRDRGGSASSVFHFLIDEPGIYPVRLLWFNGTGGSNVEWYSVRDDGVNVLINDRATEGALSAYYEKSAGERARVTAASGLNALLNGGNLNPNQTFEITLQDGTTSVDEASVSFTFNGSSDGVTVNKSGSTTTVSFAPDGLLPANEAVSVDFSWAEMGGAATRVSFNATVRDYSTIESFHTASGTGDIRGFNWRVHQQEATNGTNVAAAEAQLASDIENIADLIFADDGNNFYIGNWINFDQDGSNRANFQSGSTIPAQQVPDEFFPGIPGLTFGTDNIAGEVTTFVEFPEAKLYQMVVNSDDGFAVTLATGETTADGTVQSPTSDDAVVLGANLGTRGSSDTTFFFAVKEPGLYPFRLVWFERGGGANLEWFTVNSDGSRALINGTQPGALRAFRTRNGTAGDFVAPDPDVARPSNPIVATSDNSPGAEGVENAIDNDPSTKYLNFDAGSGAVTGLTVTPGGSIVTGLALTSANDAAERDPATYQLSGSTDGGTTFTLIVEGDVPAFADRFTRVEVSFDNQVGYITYELLFPTTVGPNQNSMQIAEIELIGDSASVDATDPPAEEAGVAIADNGDGTVTITWSGSLEGSDDVDGVYSAEAGTSPMTISADAARRFYRVQ